MKKLFIIITVLTLNLICSAQDINESIKYINDKLQKYDHSSFLIKTMNSEYAPDWDISNYDKLSILENGEAVIERIVIDEGKRSVAFEIRFFIKALADSIDITEEIDMYEKRHYIITIKCINYGCMISNTIDKSKSEKMSSYSFSLTDKTYSQRVVNALKRLITLANESDNYLEEDPFK